MENESNNKYWMTIDQWRNDPEFLKLAEQEFMSSPLKDTSGEGGWARREFLKLMGASLALGSFGCVRRPAQKIVPYAKRPADIVNGLPNYYASSFADGSEGFGVLITSREGRPVKVDGNEEHPVNQGGMSARAHAHLLSLYDPNRLAHAVRNIQNDTRTNRDTVKISFDKADEEIGSALSKGSVAVLTGSLVSPSEKSLVKDFTSRLGAKHYVWEPTGAEVMRAAHKLVFGQGVVPRLRLDQAKYILAVDADILGTYLAPTEAQKAFGRNRKPGDSMNKLVVAESLLSLTGTNADERYRIRPSQAHAFLSGILYELIVKKKRGKFAGDSRAILSLQDYASVNEELGLSSGQMASIADELWANRGRSLVVSGEDLKSQVAAAYLNELLGNYGKTLDSGQSAFTGYQGTTEDLTDLAAAIDSGRVKRLIVHGANPVYAAPEATGIKKALAKLELLVYTGTHNDETGLISDYVLPNHHELEAWGDLESYEGVFSIQQPTIRPLGETRSFGDTLIKISAAAKAGSASDSWYDYLRKQWRSRLSGDFESSWVKLLQEGVKNTNRLNSAGSLGSASRGAFSKLMRKEMPSADLELVLYSTVGLRDGSMANVSWLQEFPDPVTKLCWDNYLCISPKAAADRNITQGQIVELEVGAKKIKVPAHIQPGQSDNALGLAVGYGRTAAGEIGNNVGVNAYDLAVVEDGLTRYRALASKVTATQTRTRLANVAGHNSMEGRQIVVEATLDQFKKKPSANIHKHKMFSAWSGHEYPGHKWAMTVDLSSCTGCSACMIACQSENNTPVVGRKNVIDGREMHWMRIDRYFVGEPESPNTVYMPLMCQHCDNAPCETVCPVLATVHGDEGTNDMIYNRCVGTRYCANNCPYKVRRFNWFDYTNLKAPLNMALNPEVTVRSRGVMEKCTFCTHKIHAEKSNAKNEGREIKDGDISTACEASCPTGAITFGDMNDPESRVSKAMADERSYSLLEEWNARPSVRYQTKIRNTAELKTDGHGKGGH